MKTREIYSGRVIRLTVDTVDLPNGVQCELEIVHHPGGSAVVAVNDRQEICLLEQYRYVAGGWLWELPAGKHEPGDTPADTAKKELQEEAGVQAQHWQSLGYINSSPGVFGEVVHLYLARDLAPIAIAHENEEVIKIHWLPFQDAYELALSGQLTDAKTVVALLRAYQYLAQK